MLGRNTFSKWILTSRTIPYATSMQAQSGSGSIAPIQCFPKIFACGSLSASKNNHGSLCSCSRKYKVDERNTKLDIYT